MKTIAITIALLVLSCSGTTYMFDVDAPIEGGLGSMVELQKKVIGWDTCWVCDTVDFEYGKLAKVRCR